MTLLLESAIRTFDPSSATLTTPEDGTLEQGDPVEFSLATIYRFAAHYDSLAHPEREEWTCLPLHEPDSAALTGEYVAYTEHDLHEEIIVFADGDGQDFLPVEAFAQTPLARRLRFWHPDHIPATDPEYYEAPFDDHEPPRHSVDPAAFFDGVADYLDRERERTLDARREELADVDPAEQYADGGEAIPELRDPSVDADGTVTLHVDFDRIDGVTERSAMGEHRFVQSAFDIYPDDPALLMAPSDEHSPAAFPLQVTVTDVASTRVTVAFDWTDIDGRSGVRRYLGEDRVGFGLVKLLNPLPYERRREAIERVREDDTFREVLTGQRALTFTQPRVAESTPGDEQLNQEQRAAAKFALLADDLFCIHGPPGTGKTRTLVEVVRRAVEAGASVLVCADSNQAVDNVLVGESTAETVDPGSLHAHGQHGSGEFTVTRHNVRQSDREVVSRWYGDARGGADVVASTNGSAATLERQFDLAVVDEATQATVATSAVPLTKADTVVLAGDHRQLPPYSETEEPPAETAGRSLFEHVYTAGGVFEGVGLQLRTQYRMHRDIAYFPNREFYDRSLRTGLDVDPLADWEPIVGYDVGGGEKRRGTSLANPAEAKLVSQLVERVCDAGVSAAEVGVITPYAAQVQEVRSALGDGTDAVTVDTIDAFQGSERTVVLISLVRSNSEGSIGFLGRLPDGPRRLNVAMTRAQRLCVLVGDWATLAEPPEGRADASELYGELASLLRDTGRMREFDVGLL